MKDHDKYLESSEAVTTYSENYNNVRTRTFIKQKNVLKKKKYCFPKSLVKASYKLKISNF